jgi:hypothetical protein
VRKRECGDDWHFGGFDAPRYTPIPDALFDEVMAHLSGAELKVLLYILRRTFGFKKDSDAISLSQLCGGITKRDGTVLDQGTGLARNTVYPALRRLEALGIIVAIRQQSAERGNETTVYRPNVISPQVEKLPRGIKERPTARSKNATRLGRQSTPQETGRQETANKKGGPRQHDQEWFARILAQNAAEQDAALGAEEA